MMSGSMSQRRSKHEGTIETLKRPGKKPKFRGRVMVEGTIITGPSVEKRSHALPSLYRKIEDLAASVETLETEGPKLSSSLKSLIDNRLSKEWKPKTIELANTVLGHVEAAEIGEMGVMAIRSGDVLEWRLGLKVAASSARRYQLLLERALSMLGNPVKADKPKVREPEIRILTKAEQAHLIARAVQPRTKLALLILLRVGVRSGEACGMWHEDRFEDGMRIRFQVTDLEWPERVELKTDESRAWVPLDKELQALIGPPRKGFVLATANGTPMRPSNLRRMVQSVAEHTEYEGITPHELRHTAAVNLLRAGVDVATVASITRHSIETLLKIYHRAIPESKREAMEKLTAWREGA